MNPDSGCDATLNSEAMACINKQLAKCGSNRKYTLTPCPQGQECRALPLNNGTVGVYLQCITPSDAAAKLSPGRSSSIPSTAAPSTPSLESATPKTTVLGPSVTASEGSMTLSRQTGKASSETSLSTGAASLPNIIPSAPKPTFSLEPTTTAEVAPSSSRSSSAVAVAGSTPNHTGSPVSEFPTTTARKTTEPAPTFSNPVTLLTSTTSSKKPTPAPEASGSPSVQPSSPSESEPGISIIPEPRITNSPTATGALPAVANAVDDSVSASDSFVPGSPVTVRETVTVTTTVHDRR
ncbi:hypothetical protein MMC07_003500 [Pseudocyphellaria aurata]|nr:hypothetical protein [Pseudocyphellaria aurata]